ncbi:hypothetical protein LINPERPRIM_LOCUS7452 [Linum perenne]
MAKVSSAIYLLLVLLIITSSGEMKMGANAQVGGGPGRGRCSDEWDCMLGRAVCIKECKDCYGANAVGDCTDLTQRPLKCVCKFC